ncbi:MAG: signal peptidase II [Bdellovibrionales bacterium]|nr:signal peptidase II [Bdellovibrionales bacterium]
MMKKYLIFTSLAGATIALDQWSKLLIYTQFTLGESITVLENYFNITFVRNFGAAFGFLAESHPEFRTYFFLLIPPLAMLLVVGILRGVAMTDKLQTIALSLIFGGALGNYIDRLRFGFVVDFLDFHFQGKYSWPAFNVADMAIVIGIAILALLIKNEPKKNNSAVTS